MGYSPEFIEGFDPLSRHKTFRTLGINGKTTEVESILASNHNGINKERILAVPATERMAEKVVFITQKVLLRFYSGQVTSSLWFSNRFPRA